MFKQITMVTALGALFFTGWNTGTSAVSAIENSLTASPTGHPTTDGAHLTHGKGMHAHAPWMSPEMLSLLKMDKESLKQQLMSGKSLAEVAQAQGVSKEQMIQLLTKQHNAKVDAALKGGKISEQNANEMKQRYGAFVPKMIERKGLMKFSQFKLVLGRQKPWENDELAKLLKLEKEVLKDQLRSGRSLAEIAQTQGVPKDQVIQLLTKQYTEKLDKAVKSGKLPENTANEMKKHFNIVIPRIVEKKGLGKHHHQLQDHPGHQHHHEQHQGHSNQKQETPAPVTKEATRM
ncbi:hypothetical protein [Brevibacillus dissolubilis]|uniref:hypothetical protein n=1 Tax=Brevibacillus dissolubilis TaxID=1844116 RepID=UPI001116E0BB|nr:hypothetical protein [Brevibacillus dissolubilis]